MIALAVKCSHNPCGIDQVCVGGRFAWPRKLCGSGASLDLFHWDLVAIVAYLELQGCALPGCSPGFLFDGRYMVTWLHGA